MRKSRIKIGDIFGNLIVKSDTITHVTKSGKKFSGRICLCKLCGKEKSFIQSALSKSPSIKSCFDCASTRLRAHRVVSKEVVKQIHDRYRNQYVSMTFLAKSYGLDMKTVSDILHRKGRYKNFDVVKLSSKYIKHHRAKNISRMLMSRCRTCRLTPDQVRKIRSDYHKGDSTKQLAEKYKCGPDNIWKIVTGRSWRYLK